MTPNQVTKAIRERFNMVHTALLAVREGYDPKDVHAFRVEVKKLKAILRLAGSRIPRKLQQFYRLAGLVRQAQLQREAVLKSLPQDESTVAYLEALDREIDRRIEDARGFPIGPGRLQPGLRANDKTLHNVRKYLKGLQYVLPFLHGKGGGRTVHDLEEVTRRLGKYLDAGVRLNLLKDGSCPEALRQRLQEQWEAEREALRKQVYGADEVQKGR